MDNIIHHTDSANYAAIVRAHPDSILVVSDNNKIIFSNTAGMRFLCRLPDTEGYIPDALDLSEGHDNNIRVRDITRQELILSVHTHMIEWYGIKARLLYINDMTEQASEKEYLQTLVNRDHLTGLYNRRGLEQACNTILAPACDSKKTFTTLYIDINGLKQVNDVLGHNTGDIMICETAELLNEVFHSHEIKARIGGDEFVVFVVDEPQSHVEQLIDQLRMEVHTRNTLPGRHFMLSLSIGVVPSEANRSFDIPALLEQADQNMYRAKQRVEKSCVRSFHGRPQKTSSTNKATELRAC